MMNKPFPGAVCVGMISTPGINHGQPLPVYEMYATDEKLRKLGTPATGWHWDGHRWRKKGVNDHED